MQYRLSKTLLDLAGSFGLDAWTTASASHPVGVFFSVPLLMVPCSARPREPRALRRVPAGTAAVVTFALGEVGAKLSVERRPSQVHRVLAPAAGPSFRSNQAGAARGTAAAVGVSPTRRRPARRPPDALLAGVDTADGGVHPAGGAAGRSPAALAGVAVVAGLRQRLPSGLPGSGSRPDAALGRLPGTPGHRLTGRGATSGVLLHRSGTTNGAVAC